MKNRKVSKDSMPLLVIGLAIMALAQIVNQSFKLSDVLIGFSMGVGIGVLLLALTKMKRGF